MGRQGQRERDADGLQCMLELSRFLRAYRGIPIGPDAVSDPTPEWNVRSAVTRRSRAVASRIREEGRLAGGPPDVRASSRRQLTASLRRTPSLCL